MEGNRCFSTSIFYDRLFDTKVVKILPGQYHANDNNTFIVTVLGSCVSVCIYDVVRGVGGMNHYMLPGNPGESFRPGDGSARYGVNAMPLLIDHVIQLGGERGSLEAKVFGAGKVMDGMSDVGRQNADFALNYLKEQNIKIAAVDVGDNFPRKIFFSPATGQVFVRRIQKQMLSPEQFQSLFGNFDKQT